MSRLGRLPLPELPRGFSFRLLGVGFLIGWVYSAFFTPALIPNADFESSAFELYWTLSLISVSLSVLAITALERRFGAISEHPSVRIVAPLLLAGGTLLIAAGGQTQAPIGPAFGYSGAVATGVGAAFMYIMWGIFYSRVSAEETEAGIPLAVALALVIALALQGIQGHATVFIVAALPIISGLLLRLDVVPTTEPVPRAEACPPAVTGPLHWQIGGAISMLVLTVTFARALVSPSAAEGFSSAFSAALLGGAVVAFAVFYWFISLTRRMTFSAVFRYVIPLTCVGLLLAAILPAEYRTIAYVFCFVAHINLEIQTWILCADLVRKGINTPTRAFGSLRFFTQVGGAVGAAFAPLLVAQSLGLVVAALMTLIICAFMLALTDSAFLGFGTRGASADSAGSQTRDSRPDTLESRCIAIATQHSLSGREAEVMLMLARGRDLPYIRDKLVISRNTVNTHVKHIYAKLGIHSKQDLIDMVDSPRAGAPRERPST